MNKKWHEGTKARHEWPSFRSSHAISKKKNNRNSGSEQVIFFHLMCKMRGSKSHRTEGTLSGRGIISTKKEAGGELGVFIAV